MAESPSDAQLLSLLPASDRGPGGASAGQATAATGASFAAAAALLTSPGPAVGSSAAAPALGGSSPPTQGSGGRGATRERPSTPDSIAKGHYASLHVKVDSKVRASKQQAVDMHQALARAKEAYRSHQLLLRELDRERIDLQASVAWLASTRENWRRQHEAQGLAPSSELDRRFAEEESITLAEIRDVQTHITLASRQTTRLRQASEAIERHLGDNKLRLEAESDLLNHCKGSLYALDQKMGQRVAAKKAGKAGVSQPWRASVVEPDRLTHQLPTRSAGVGRNRASIFVGNAGSSLGSSRGGRWTAR